MKPCLIALAAGTWSALLYSTTMLAAPDDWAEGVPGREDGANHTYYNRGGQLPWRNREGDWRDADGVPQGKKPLAVASIAVQNEPQAIEWDITTMVRDWASGKVRHKGVMLRKEVYEQEDYEKIYCSEKSR